MDLKKQCESALYELDHFSAIINAAVSGLIFIGIIAMIAVHWVR